MARKKSTATNGNGANLGFEATLWAAADKLRGHLDAAEYKHKDTIMTARYNGPVKRSVNDQDVFQRHAIVDQLGDFVHHAGNLILGRGERRCAVIHVVHAHPRQHVVPYEP
jgi:hypothetical protein